MDVISHRKTQRIQLNKFCLAEPGFWLEPTDLSGSDFHPCSSGFVNAALRSIAVGVPPNHSFHHVVGAVIITGAPP